jgi:PAS domain S-box-containing protein
MLLGLAGAVYLTWWFLVEKVLPGSFNPLLGRLLVVGYFFTAFALTALVPATRRYAEHLFYVGAVALTGHYFYLLHNNAEDMNWVLGVYVLVFALSVGVQSRAWLFTFSGLSFGLGILVWALEPLLQQTIFLPGLATINLLCVVVMLNRLRLLTDLSESTGRFQGLFDAAFEGVAVHDQGKIRDANAAFAALFGYSREQLIGMSVLELNAPECRALVAQQISEVPTNRYESVGQRKDGTRVPIEVSTKPHVYQGRQVRLAAIRDLSDAKRADEERNALVREQSARANAQEAIRLRDEFMSIASHELRTPLTSLQLQVETFVRKWRKASDVAALRDEVETFSLRAGRQLHRLNRLIEELLDISRFEAGKITLHPEELELETLVREAVDSLSEDLQRAGCKVEVRAAGPIRGFWDRLRLEQVTANLLRNAMIYGVGKPIEIEARSSDHHAMIRVRDHGIGIEKEKHEKIFLRYERAAPNANYGGLGLGLYIARQLVEAHQGTIRVDSEPGEGSTFSVELPLRALQGSGSK